MLQIVTKYFCFAIMISTCYLGIKSLVNPKESFLKVKNIVTMLFLILILSSLYAVEYNFLFTFFSASLIIVSYSLIVNEETIDVLIAGILVYISLFFSDFLVAIFLTPFIKIGLLRSTWYFQIILNLVIAVVILIICNSHKLKKIYTKLKMIKIEKKKMNNVILIILVLFVLCSLAYFCNYMDGLNLVYVVDSIVISFVFVSSLLLCTKNIQYNDLENEYDELFVYVQNFENWIEQEQLTRHEYKNQLGSLLLLTSDNAIKEKINEIIKDTISIDDKMILQLSNFPSNGLKGLLYYKIITANKLNYNVCIDIGNGVSEKIKKLSEKKLKILCRLIGIYFDNAIEELCNTKVKDICIEVYLIHNSVVLAITNSVNKKVEFRKFKTKGYSTKGNGRGNGLYFADKIIKKYNWLSEEKSQSSGYYTQKIIFH